MLLVADVHGAFADLERVAGSGEPILVLGDFLNFIDYRTHEGMLAEVAGREFVAELVELRSRSQYDAAREMWRNFAEGREQEIRDSYDRLIEAAYTRAAEALGDAEAYVTYGNVDRPDVLQATLPATARFVDGEVVEIDGWRVGIAGGGVPALGVPGEVADDEMRAKLAAIGEVDILCTHVAPAVRPLSRDVIGGRPKESQAVVDHIMEFEPRWHYFGDIHQPQAISWRVGSTISTNVGYFRATGRAVRHVRPGS
jgi:Icc-related predicted phosphoesterase